MSLICYQHHRLSFTVPKKGRNEGNFDIRYYRNGVEERLPRDGWTESEREKKREREEDRKRGYGMSGP